jgi:hypothetical protein
MRAIDTDAAADLRYSATVNTVHVKQTASDESGVATDLVDSVDGSGRHLGCNEQPQPLVSTARAKHLLNVLHYFSANCAAIHV